MSIENKRPGRLPSKPGLKATQRQGATSPAAARPIIEGRRISKSVVRIPRNPKDKPSGPELATAPGFASGTAVGATSIVELARALRENVDLIFEFVHENIEWLPTFGSQKGALGTLIDGYGNSFDQSDLMIELLREAGYTAEFQLGELELSESEAADWLGTDVNIWAESNLLSDGGIPNETHWTGSNWVIRFSHVFVKVDIGGTDYVFDPSRKSYDTTSGISLATAMDYDGTEFLDDATDGATITSDYVQDLNRDNIRSTLATYTQNLVDWIKTNNHAATVDDILGSKRIVHIEGPIRDTALSYLRPSTTPTTWTDIPDAYKATLHIVYDDPNINVTFFSNEIHGKRVTLFFNSSREAELRVDGTLIASSSAQGVGTWNSVLLDTQHPYPTTFADEAHWQIVWAEKYYLIAQAWGNAGRMMGELHRQKLKQNLFDGGDPLDENVYGESLSVTWHQWNAQKSRGCDLLNKLTNCITVLHHQTGLLGHYDTVFTDLGGIVWASSALDNNWDNVDTNDTALAMHGIQFEASVLQEMAGVGGVSTTPLIDIAAANGLKIYDGNSTNWASTVRPSLVNYDTQTLDDIENWWINWDWRVAIPEDGDLSKDNWEGLGYYAISPWYGAIGIIGGGLKGASASVMLPPEDEEEVVLRGGVTIIEPVKEQDDVRESEEPIGLTGGYYTHRNVDLSVGTGEFPYKLDFQRVYNSKRRLSDGPLGLGWSHNLLLSISEASNNLLALGELSAIASAPAFVQLYVVTELFRDLSKPIDKFVIAALANQWLVDQLFKNVLTVNIPGFSMPFVRLPDGSYVTASGDAVELTKNIDGSFTLETTGKIQAEFDSSGKLTAASLPTGVTVEYQYTSGKLTSVSNGMERTLTLSYTGDRLSSVSDGTRTVSFDVDSNGHLVSVVDPTSEATVYEYDNPGLLTKIYRPANPTVPVITNTYDSLNRVKEQRDSSDNLWQYFLAGSRAEEVDPANNSRIFYFDRIGNDLKTIRCCGAGEITKEFDGLGRLIKLTMAEGNFTQWTYDSRNRIVELRKVAKPGSGLDDKVSTSTYESNFGKLETYTDPEGNLTTFYYDSETGNLSQIDYPEINSQTPKKFFTFNERGQILTYTNELGSVTKYEYDDDSEVLLSVIQDFGTGRLNLTTSYGYNAQGDTTEITDANGNTSYRVFDEKRRLVQTTSSTPFSFVTEYAHDENDNLVEVKRATGNPLDPWQIASATYSPEGLLTSVVNPDNKETTIEYNSFRQIWKITDPENRVIEYTYDDQRRLAIVTNEASNVSEERTYTTNGLLASIEDANGNLTELTYDGFDRASVITFADESFQEFEEYDSNDRVIAFRTRAGDLIEYTYDELNRCTSKSPGGQPTITYSYDLCGRLLSAETPVVSGDPSTGSFTFGFDTAGRLTSEQCPDGKETSFELDGIGNWTKITYPDSYYVERFYDELNRLTDVKLNGSSSAALHFDYDALSRRTALTYDNGCTVEYQFEKNNDINSLLHTFGSSSVEFSNTYNSAHERLTQSVSDAQFMWHPVSGGTITYGTANELNQYPTVGGNSFTYDQNGCVTGDGTWTFAYDVENRLISAAKTGVSASYLYDPHGRQIQKTVGTSKTRYVYALAQRIADYDGSTDTLIERYVYGLTLDEALIRVSSGGVISYLHLDQLGSVIAHTDNSGAIINTYSYSPWGESSSLPGTTFGFTGQRYDSETGLYFFKNRYYSPQLGRFLQPDPLQYGTSLNPYLYAQNDPLRFIDPLGLEEEFKGQIATIAMLGVITLFVTGLIVKKPDPGERCITDGEVSEMYINPVWGFSAFDMGFAAFTQFFADTVGCPPPGASNQVKGQWGEALSVAWLMVNFVLTYPTTNLERTEVTFTNGDVVRARPDLYYRDVSRQADAWGETKTTEGLTLPPISSSLTANQRRVYPALATGINVREAWYGFAVPFTPLMWRHHQIFPPIPIQLFRICYEWV